MMNNKKVSNSKLVISIIELLQKDHKEEIVDVMLNNDSLFNEIKDLM
jgi:hypothetical protein